jgi:hypothetical protein
VAATARRSVLDPHHPGPRPPQHQRREQPDGPQPGDHHHLLEHHPRVERDLEGGLDQREQRRLSRVHAVEGHDVLGPGDEAVLVGMECEHEPILGHVAA